MSNPYFRFTNGALRMKGVQRVQYVEPVQVFPPTSVTVSVIEPTPAPVSTPEPAPAPLEVEAPAEVAEAPAESGLVPEDPPA